GMGVGEADQARYLAQSLAMARSLEGVAAYLWYALLDEEPADACLAARPKPCHADRHFGLFDLGRQPKPAAGAFLGPPPCAPASSQTRQPAIDAPWTPRGVDDWRVVQFQT